MDAIKDQHLLLLHVISFYFCILGKCIPCYHAPAEKSLILNQNNKIEQKLFSFRTHRISLLISLFFSPEPEVEENISLHAPWTVSRLEDKDLINQAKALMYRIYIKEMGWQHAENTPTGEALFAFPLISNSYDSCSRRRRRRIICCMCS